MRLMSFSMTQAQILAKTKFVTRRLGWVYVRPGMQVMPVVKSMGLRKGEKATMLLTEPLTIVSVRRESLREMTDDPEYGMAEVALEGFAGHSKYGTPEGFVTMFCEAHKGKNVTPETRVTRLALEYGEVRRG
jgi:hypothetical protein